MSQAIPFGPSAISPNDLLTTCTYAFAIPGTDTLMSTVFNSGYARRIYCNTSGTLFLSRANDGVNLYSYTVTAGGYIDGNITRIGGTGTGSTSMTVNLEY
ncbi:MAG TPA: hypothetical protein VGJ79_08910 [Candidatus Dormibacteraeota bacterium]|jgi:hypothetical protein